MDEILQAWTIVLGEETIDGIIAAIKTIAIVAAVLIVLIVILLIYKSATTRKIKKNMLALSETPDSAHAKEFITAMSHISGFGRFLAKISFRYSGLSKSDCRAIYNSSIVNSKSIEDDDKQKIRKILMSIGCNGLQNQAY